MDVYYGGISRKEDGVLVQYEFIADAYTGTILDLYKL
jgi:predicted small secreted protein